MKALTDALDFLIMLITLVVGLSFTLLCINLTQHTRVTEINDKTAVVAMSEIQTQDVVLTNEDVLLMLAVVDKYQPEPKRVYIENTKRIHFNEAWFVNKDSLITSLYTDFFRPNVGRTVKELTLTRDGGILEWKILYE